MSDKDKSDDSLFKKSIGKVQRLKQDKVNLRPKQVAPIQVRNPDGDAATSIPTVGSTDILSFRSDRCPQKLFNKLKRGKIPSEEHIDLHSMTVQEAKNYLDTFLDECMANESFCVGIVHGKGRKQADAPILKNEVNAWLRQDDRILAFHSAPTNQGGTGAVLVLLSA